MEKKNKAKAIERLQNVLDQIQKLTKYRHNSPEFKKWFRDSKVTIIHTFGDNSTHLKDFESIIYLPAIRLGNIQKSEWEEAYFKGLEEASFVLKSMVYEVNEYWEEGENSNRNLENRANTTNIKKVFVIHGHDDSARESVARFLEKLELKPVILHEQPNKGRTIIEKFEDHADVGFAVVLLTPDDIGAAVKNRDKLRPRARQNVILELGFFLGRLGRERVCPLVKGDVETPSDYDGVVYTKLDEADGWKMKLVQELKAAGFDIDANRAFGP
ncbi:MAG: nucleotide-binding protein [Rhodospirillaceae bacterium]|nr:nucleotide-binding protein [Rhodospirillaceae bacterium]MDE0256170.1 nucleotide-binding protein [Rhodospirillaceae bacterium]MDE0618471.1 nucleotide-binding protein [Rhodospirillaceae bacterium]